MRATSTLGALSKSPPRLLLIAGIGLTLVILALAIPRIYRAWNFSRGPFLEFEIRLPQGILLPGDKHIEVTLWSEEMGLGCKVKVQRALDPIELAGKCSIIRHRRQYALSVRLSGYAEGYWYLPTPASIDLSPVFGPWQRVEFTRAPVGPSEVSSLPYGEYYVRYLVRP